jgi:hypothetical protein
MVCIVELDELIHLQTIHTRGAIPAFQMVQERRWRSEFAAAGSAHGADEGAERFVDCGFGVLLEGGEGFEGSTAWLAWVVAL